eukprot:gene8989-1320_t
MHHPTRQERNISNNLSHSVITWVILALVVLSLTFITLKNNYQVSRKVIPAQQNGVQLSAMNIHKPVANSNRITNYRTNKPASILINSHYGWANRTEELKLLLPHHKWKQLMSYHPMTSPCHPTSLKPYPLVLHHSHPEKGFIYLICHGQFGNRLGEYVVARIISHIKQWPIKMCDSLKIISISQKAIFPYLVDNVINTTNLSYLPEFKERGHNYDIDRIVADDTPRIIVLDGYPFSNYSLFAEYKNLIKDDWLLIDTSCVTPKVTNSFPGTKDIVVHIRAYRGCGLAPNELKDGLNGPFVDLPWEYYVKILEWHRVHTGWDVLWVSCRCSGNHNITQSLVTNYKARLVPRTGVNPETEDWLFMQHATYLIMSQSTFAWWAAWLGNAEIVHYPLIGDWWGDNARHKLYPIDEPRYFYHDLLKYSFFLNSTHLKGA